MNDPSSDSYLLVKFVNFSSKLVLPSWFEVLHSDIEGLSASCKKIVLPACCLLEIRREFSEGLFVG
jgi:hypothetical protein